MSDSMEILRRKINSARELGSVVRTMKALAAASITQYEQAVRSLSEYYHAVELGLHVYFRETAFSGALLSTEPRESFTTAIVFGSDQGLVGQFNDHLAAFVLAELDRSTGARIVWTVGERIRGKLQDAGLSVVQFYSVPNSVTGITPLVSQILIDRQTGDQTGGTYVFHNRPVGRQNYVSAKQRLLPLDATWQQAFSQIRWPTDLLPEVLGSGQVTIPALIREYLFVSLFKSCAESLASENACRLTAMQRAQRNIDELLDRLQMAFNQQRQTSIDEELFDVISGFEALADQSKSHRSGRRKKEPLE